MNFLIFPEMNNFMEYKTEQKEKKIWRYKAKMY